MTVILGPDFARRRGLPSAKLADVQPQPPPTRAPIGRTPWHVVRKNDAVAVVNDRDGCTLITAASAGIAHQIATSVNAYVPLSTECADLIDLLRTVQAELRIGSAEDAVKRARELLDNALTPGGTK